MRHIEFIAPVAAVRGNLSGKQNLLYPTKNNSAWDSPSNKRNYATNYTPRYVGAKRSRDGRTYFAVKQRAAVNMSPLMRTQQALIGGSKVVSDYIMHDGAHIQSLQVLYMRSQIYRDGGSFYKWVSTSVRDSLKSKWAGIFFNGDGSISTIVYQNPWISTTAPGTPVAVTIPQDILVKFWNQLADSPIMFQVDGREGIAHSGQSFNDITNSARLNVLGLQNVASKVTMGDSITSGGTTLYPIVATRALVEGEYVYTDVSGSDTITANGEYYIHYASI